jgi:hypothetical protein
MNKSKYEIIVERGCPDCVYADQETIAKMKELFEKEDWVTLDDVFGWCTYAFKLEYDENLIKCLRFKAKEK